MNKREFLAALSDKLKSYPQQEVEKTLDYFKEIIEEKVEEGLSEEEAVLSLGSLDEMIRELGMEAPKQSEWEEKTFITADKIEHIHVISSVDDVVFQESMDEYIHVITKEKEGHTYSIQVSGAALRIELKCRAKMKEKKAGLANIFKFLSYIKDKETLEIHLPEEKYRELKVETASGDIEIEGFVFEKLHLTSVSGDISVEAIAEEILVNSTSGDVEMRQGRGNSLVVSNVSGDLNISDSRFKDTFLKGVSSDIEFTNFDGEEIRIKTVSGDIEGSVLSPKQFKAKTLSGDISLPKSEGDDLFFAETVSGDVEIELAE